MASNNIDCHLNLLDNHDRLSSTTTSSTCEHSIPTIMINDSPSTTMVNLSIIPSSPSTSSYPSPSSIISSSTIDHNHHHCNQQNMNNNLNKNMNMNNNNNKQSDVRLVWNNLSYIIKDNKGKTRPLIKNLNGSINDGQLTAIIGPSGSGKTTLIECLAGRRIEGVKGDISIKYTGIKKSSIKISYYSQSDSLDELLTVEESLNYALQLRNCQRVAKKFYNNSIFNCFNSKDATGNSIDYNKSTSTTIVTNGKKDELSECCLLTCDDYYYSDNNNHHHIDINIDSNQQQQPSKSMINKCQIVKSSKNLKNENDLIIKRIVNELHLDKCLKNLVGKCSGGQKRRLSIALELIFSPKILLLDEPTSGLDSLSSLQCIQMLRKLVKNQRQPMMIATSIHQPTAKILSLFDNFYIISYNGYCIYNGPTENLITKLSEFGLHCPQYHNPADFIIEIATGDFGDDIIMNMEMNFRQTCTNQASNDKSNCCFMIDNQSNTMANDHQIIGVDDHQEQQPLKPIKMKSLSIHKLVKYTQKHSFIGQLLAIWVLLRRTLLISSRDYNIYIVRLATIVTILILLFILYYDNPIGQLDGCALPPTRKTIEQLQSFELFELENSYYSNFGFLFFSVMLMVFVSILPTLLTFPLAVSVFMKENFNGWYSLKSYYIARNLADLPPMFIIPLLYGCLSYWLTSQLFDLQRFILYQLILIIVSLLAQGLGFIVSSFFVKDVTTSTVVGGTINIPLFLFTGLLIKISAMPKYFQPFTYLSYFRLGFESLLVILYGMNRCENNDNHPITYEYLKHEFGDNLIDMYVCIHDYSSSLANNLTDLIDKYNDKFIYKLTNESSSSLALSSFKYNDMTLTVNLCIMLVYLFLLRMIAYYILYRKTSIK